MLETSFDKKKKRIKNHKRLNALARQSDDLHYKS